MDTKWISSSTESWWRDYRLGARNVENVFIIVFIMLIPTFIIILLGGVEFPSIVKLNYSENQTIPTRVNYIDALFDSQTYRESRLIQRSVELSNIVYDQTNYLKDIENCETKEDREKIILRLQEYSNSYVGVVIIDNNTGDYYSNRSWFYEPPESLSPPKEVIEGLAQNDNWVYKSIKPTENLEEIYFYDGKRYDGEIYSIRISFVLTSITTLILIILILKKLSMIKRMGGKYYIENIKGGYAYKCIISIGIIFNRNIIVEEILKDKVFIFTLFATAIYSIFYVLVDQINFWVGYEFLTYYNVYIGVAIFLVVHFILKFVRKYDSLAIMIDNLNDIKQGEAEVKINNDEDKQIKKLAKGINKLKVSYTESIQEGIKNEKLKTELISNVSHDLKTPLTSIINYVNILQRKDVTDDEKREYIKILETKSYRLKTLIEDLFEVSKMNSGKVELTMMEIDIVQLVYQCIIEVEDVYSEKEMEFKVKAPDEVIINVDPERISRVLLNLATNSLKYGLDKTRIYIEIKDDKDFVEISFKNISAFELDFDNQEILERFVRGDKSRNSIVEGSGLGLAIAKTIVELHDGQFRVECEGDLFKAYIILPRNK